MHKKSLPHSLWRHRRTLTIWTTILAFTFLIASSFRESLHYMIFGPDVYTSSSRTREPYRGRGRRVDAEQDPIAAPWTFDVAVDRNNHKLTREQCTIAFPRLYEEIDRAHAHWSGKLRGKKFTTGSLDLSWTESGMRVMIYNNELYITESKGLNHFLHWEERSKATLNSIYRALLASPEPLPNVEFAISIKDMLEMDTKKSKTPIWGFSRDVTDRSGPDVWLIPEFSFWTYPRVAGSFADFQRRAQDGAVPFAKKKDKLVWRGTPYFNFEVRLPLLAQSANQTWSDVRPVDESVLEQCPTKHADAAARISMADHCSYKYAMHTEGTTWSSRLSYLLSCNTVMLAHQLRYKAHLYHLLEHAGPQQNYVLVRRDFADLGDKMKVLMANPQQSQLIADNAARVFRDQYLTPAAQTCYWRQLIHAWSTISHEPDPWIYEPNIDGYMEKMVRGITYEEYTLSKRSYPENHEKCEVDNAKTAMTT